MNKITQENLLRQTDRCKELYDTGILEQNNVFTFSALTEILIRLNHVLQNLRKSGKRVAWRDDIAEGDITELVNCIRNAACHSESELNKLGNNTLIFNTIKGRGYLIKIGDTLIGSDYNDDVAFNFGSRIIYLHRHIYRLLQELPITLSEIETKL